MQRRWIGLALAMIAVAVALVALWWPGGPDSPCLRLAATEQVRDWRRLEVGPPAVAEGSGALVCRATWSDPRRPDRVVLALALHRGAHEARTGPEVLHLQRGGAEVEVTRVEPGRAVVIVPLGAGAWAEIRIDDEQQGDVTYWVDQVLARKAQALAALAPSGRS